MSEKFIVIITNEILGNRERVMTYDEIKNYNVAAKLCADKVREFGKPHTIGMWTVKKWEGR